ncbi:hypothetical protein BDK92_7212 [Micromonospora pisi]|uniref:Uncharacterized protein n=1 Tax=Micromonospora pisi TaxID=589240 RepID=A0A495JWV2_9ACTN|nr:hypothetical protein [Micromonospora pisi]RKR92734.1 hypothetical protein BDK92_7212 [Micromonospora pisi]
MENTPVTVDAVRSKRRQAPPAPSPLPLSTGLFSVSGVVGVLGAVSVYANRPEQAAIVLSVMALLLITAVAERIKERRP